MQHNGNKVILIVMDGWGINQDYEGNAVTRASTPTFDQLWAKHPHMQLLSSGKAVGLPEGQMGTSEVNHLTIGAGRIVYQNLVKINNAIEDGSFQDNPAFTQVFDWVKEKQSRLHLMGLLSDGGVHSHQEHLFALLRACCAHGVNQVLLHLISDGRDASMHGMREYLPQLEQVMNETGVGKIVSLVGRYFAMDRDHNWERTDKAYQLITQAQGEKQTSAIQAVENSYANNITDEYIEPVWLGNDQDMLKDDDGLIFFNFRNDRPRQLTERILSKGPRGLKFVTMTEYEPSYGLEVAFPTDSIEKPLGEHLSLAGIKQLRITETEKFAHMTFFLNCKREDPYEGEDRIMLDTYSDIKTHDQRPEMRALDIAREIVQDIESETHQVIFTNLCNPDIVGHTGNIPAAIKACETVDRALELITKAARAHDYHVIITADHGNAEEMLNSETGEPITTHSLYPVPLILVSSKWISLTKSEGLLTDIAPTILTILGLPIPSEMTGTSLISTADQTV